MFEFTNEQRLCFGLPPVADSWERVQVKPSPHDPFLTFAYLDGNRVQKIILLCESTKAQYCEMQLQAVLSADRSRILPKTEKSKPKRFSSSNLLKSKAVGMAFYYANGSLTITNETSGQTYYQSRYNGLDLSDFSSFQKWVAEWCARTGPNELWEIREFAAAERVRQNYREGDFFRFRINRTLYGYGRILLDFSKMRKANMPFWDIFMGKPLCVAVYHIATERDDVTPEELAGLPTLPSQMIFDNIFFYGEAVIIGNMPIPEEYSDYPIHYGKPISILETGVCYQCGKTFIALDDKQALYSQYRNGGIGWNLDVSLPILQKCIETGSNQPYWDLYYPYMVEHDLRNPKFHEHLIAIRQQVGIQESCSKKDLF